MFLAGDGSHHAFGEPTIYGARLCEPQRVVEAKVVGFASRTVYCEALRVTAPVVRARWVRGAVEQDGRGTRQN